MISKTNEHETQEQSLDLRDSDREVLEFLLKEPMSAIGFNGIRRRLGIHPERLSRALQRLERDDLVEKTELGYRLTGHARSMSPPTAMQPAAVSFPVLQTFLPLGLDRLNLAASLRGKWFGSLRWYGLMEAPEELTLTWSLQESDVRITARLRTGALSIEAQVSEPSQFPAAVSAAHELFRHIAETHGQTRIDGGLSAA